MGHVPHILLPAPWPDAEIPVGDIVRHHLVRVLRTAIEAPVSYTDGAGTRGSGMFTGTMVVRGEEVVEPDPAPSVTVAVAAPTNQDRCRFVVEKLAEIGVDALQWITTQFSQGRQPRPDKAVAWATAALQQSRGARLMQIHDAVPISALDPQVQWFVADRSGGRVQVERSAPVGLVVGPEGGLSTEEVARFDRKVRLGPSVLRTETAAIIGAAHCLELVGRH